MGSHHPIAESNFESYKPIEACLLPRTSWLGSIGKPSSPLRQEGLRRDIG
jgi:hypothetical protein